MKNRTNLLLIGTILLIVTASGGLMSCEDIAGLSLDPGIKGVWYDDWTEVVISDYLYYPSSTSDGTSNYTATVIEHVEDTWNAGDSGAGSHGYFIIRYNNTPSWYAADSLTDKYMVVRWQNLTLNSSGFSVEYSEGSNDSDFSDDQPGDVFDTAEAARTGATTASGHFGGFSTLTR